MAQRPPVPPPPTRFLGSSPTRPVQAKPAPGRGRLPPIPPPPVSQNPRCADPFGPASVQMAAARRKRRAAAVAAAAAAVPGTAAAAVTGVPRTIAAAVAPLPVSAPRPVVAPQPVVAPRTVVAPQPVVAPRPVVVPPPSAATPPAAPARVPAARRVETKNRLISYQQLAGYISSPDYFVNVRCNIGGPSVYGYMIKIIRKDKSENTTMAYFHLHKDSRGEITSAHFKAGNGKRDGQDADLWGKEMDTLTKGLARIAGQTKSSIWVDLKSLVL